MTGNITTLPGISVVVITRNEARNIGPCLDSLARQDYPTDRWECIVVDASTDDTPTLAAAVPFVTVLRSPPGFATQRNAGIRAARFDWVAFCDADAIIPTGWLKGIAAGIRDFPQADGLAGDAFPPPDTDWLGKRIAAVGHPAGGSLGLEANTPVGYGELTFVPGCNGAFRKSALLAVGGYDPAFDPGGEDIDLSRRLRAAGHVLAYHPAMFLYHKPHGPLGRYVRWNIGVGRTRYLLRRPGAAGLMFWPGSLLWPGMLMALSGWLLGTHPSLAWMPVVVSGGVFLATLCLTSRPFRMLREKRRELGLGQVSVWLIVPALIYLRQLGMGVGMIQQWWREKRGGSPAPR